MKHKNNASPTYFWQKRCHGEQRRYQGKNVAYKKQTTLIWKEFQRVCGVAASYSSRHGHLCPIAMASQSKTFKN